MTNGGTDCSTRGLLARLRAPRLRCSFCARNSAEVSRLVAGRSGYICDDCIAKCVDVLEAHGGFEPAGKLC